MDSDPPTTELIAPGTRVDRYIVRSLAGSGGMGEVYRADDETLGRSVALKFLNPLLARESVHRERFLRESKAVAALSDPNIVHVYEIGEFEGRPYFAMEFVDGRTLREVIAGDRLTIPDAIRLATNVAVGLNAAHSAGIVHRDLKPANIVVDSTGRARILDFGLARQDDAEPITKSGTTLGTMAYMSPEQVRGERVDPRSDLFSLGSILYEMIAGRPAFAGDTDAATAHRILNHTPPPLARYVRDAPDAVQSLVDKLLEKSADTRSQSAAEVVADLKRLSRDDANPPATPVRSFPVRGAMIATLIVAALAAGFWFTRGGSDPVTPPDTTSMDQPERIAVMRFDNMAEPGDPGRWGDILASLLITDLTEARGTHVVSRQRVAEAVREADEGATVFELAKTIGANRIVTGQVLGVNPVVVTCELIDVDTKDVIASNRLTGAIGEDVFALVDHMTDDLRRSLTGITDNRSRNVADVTTHSTAAYRLYVEALDLQDELRRDDAKERLLEAVSIDSTFCAAYLELALTVGPRDPDAIRYLKRARDELDQASWKLRARVLGVAAEWIENDPEKGLEISEEAVARDPYDLTLLRDLAAVYGDNTRWLDAAAIWHRIIDIEPTHRLAHNNLAYMLTRAGDYDQALSAINRYVELAPDEPNPYHSRGDILVAAGHLEAGIASYRRSIEIDPEFSSGTPMTIARVLATMGDDEATRAEFNIMLSSADPRERTRGFVGRGIVLGLNGRIREALPWMDRAAALADSLDNHRSAATIRLHRADYHAVLGDTASERADIEWALPKESGASVISGWSIERYCRFLILHGHRDDVAPWIDRLNANSVDPKNVAAVRAWLAEDAGDYGTAVDFLEEASIRFHDFMGYYELGRLHLLNGDAPAAIRELERADRTHDAIRAHWVPFNATIYHLLGRAYELVGRHQESQAAHRRFLDMWESADVEIPELAESRAAVGEG